MVLWSVIPAHNEENTIVKVIDDCLGAGSQAVLVVENGSWDNTLWLARNHSSSRVHTCHVQEPLGPDIPRCLGAYIAYKSGADAILFCDGDLSGNIRSHLSYLMGSMTWGYDLALSQCYPKGIPYGGMAGEVTRARMNFNQTTGRPDLGISIMSHGPACISKGFLQTLPCHVLGIPPLAQALAIKTGLVVKIGSTIAHEALGSKERHGDHPRKIADTIIGDCIAASSVYEGGLPLRCLKGKPFIGYDRNRRWDLLNSQIQIIETTGFPFREPELP